MLSSGRLGIGIEQKLPKRPDSFRLASRDLSAIFTISLNLVDLFKVEKVFYRRQNFFSARTLADLKSADVGSISAVDADFVAESKGDSAGAAQPPSESSRGSWQRTV